MCLAFWVIVILGNNVPWIKVDVGQRGFFDFSKRRDLPSGEEIKPFIVINCVKMA